MKKVTAPQILSLKNKRKISALTAYDYTFAKILNDSEIDIILIGDSLSSIVHGNKSTVGVTLEDVIYHSKHVAKACNYSLVVADMPFMSFQESNEVAFRNAARLMQEGKAQAVKVEGGENIFERVKFLTNYDIVVMGHVGLTPQSYHRLGGHKKQGKENSVFSSEQILKDALAVQEAGCFAIVLEHIPEELAEEITERLRIPTIGIGSGSYCDGQIAVTHDILGLCKAPKFIEAEVNLAEEIKKVVTKFKS